MSRITLLALLAVSASFTTSDPVTGPAGVYSVTTAGPTRVTSGDGWVKIEWQVKSAAKPSEPTPPEPPKATPWRCEVCREPITLDEHVTPHHVGGQEGKGHEAVLSNADLKTIVDELRMRD